MRTQRLRGGGLCERRVLRMWRELRASHSSSPQQTPSPPPTPPQPSATLGLAPGLGLGLTNAFSFPSSVTRTLPSITATVDDTGAVVKEVSTEDATVETTIGRR